LWRVAANAPVPAAGAVGRFARSEDFATLTRVKDTAHGTKAGWHTGCRCDLCRRGHSDDQRARGRARAQRRLPAHVRQQLLNAIYAGQPFRAVFSDLRLPSNGVWGLAKTDEEWATKLEAALAATRRDDLKHGTNAAYVHGCVCWSVRSTSALGWRDNLSNSPRNEL
jgi:hypothetical protein